MKKVLIITYYWPPKGGVGVQRWLKLAKYLSQTDYKPIIYTPKNGVTPLDDNTLLDAIPDNIEILKRRIFEPQQLFKIFTKKRPASDILVKQKSSVFHKLLIWLRANLFIPDSRCFWIQPSINFLHNYLKKNPVDVVISTGPPHSMHMIAFGIQKKHNIQWIADFRDPWTDIEYFDHLPLLSMNRKKHIKMEKRVVCNADAVLTVSQSWANDFMNMGAKKTFVLTNGYDTEDYSYSPYKKISNEFNVGHFGLYNKLRDHSFFWETLQDLSKNISDFNSNLKFIFSGEVHADFFNQIKSFQFDSKLEYHTYLNHKESVKKMTQCDLLLVSQGDSKAVSGRLPAKLFEYLGARKPILAIGKKNSDLEKIVSSISYAWFVDFNNTKLLYDTILEIYKLRMLNNNFNDDISSFSREYQVGQLINLIDSL